MHQNLLWQALLGILFLCTLWYTASATYQYLSYTKLTSQKVPTTIQWSIEKKSEDKFILEAHYQFTTEEKSFSGTTNWQEEPYRNQWGAERAIKENLKKNWLIWYDKKNPQHSSLKKHFPFKEIISAVFLWILFLYFLWIGYYATTFKS